jgi:hypothetical protein
MSAAAIVNTLGSTQKSGGGSSNKSDLSRGGG